MNTFFVVAGSQTEFDDYLKSKIFPEPMRKYVWLYAESQVQGHANPKGVFYGSWRKLPNILNIIDALQICSNFQNKSLLKIRDSITRAKDLIVYYNGVVQHPSEYVVVGDTVTLYNNSNSMVNSVLQTKTGHMSEFIIAPNSSVRVHYDKL